VSHEEASELLGASVGLSVRGRAPTSQGAKGSIRFGSNGSLRSEEVDARADAPLFSEQLDTRPSGRVGEESRVPVRVSGRDGQVHPSPSGVAEQDEGQANHPLRQGHQGRRRS
jgi:hypothetical protein